MIFQFLRFLLVITGTIVGVAFAYGITDQYENFLEIDSPELKFAALLGCIGYLLCSMAGRELQMWLESKIENTNSATLVWGAMGTLIGLVAGNLLYVPVYVIMYKGWAEIRFANKYFNSLVPLIHLVVPLFFNLLFAYLGARIVGRFREIGRAHV